MWREQLGQVFKQLRPMPILGVDQQIVFVWQRLAGPGIDGVWPQDDRATGWLAHDAWR